LLIRGDSKFYPVILRTHPQQRNFMSENKPPDKSDKVLNALQYYSRLGFIAHGLIFVSFGTMLLIFVAKYDRTIGFKGTMLEISGEAYGKIIIMLIAVGLTGLALWRFFQCFLNTEKKDNSLWSYYVRFTYLVLGLFYLWLTVSLLTLIWTSRISGQFFIYQEVSFLLSKWYGQIFLIVTGLAIAGIAIYQIRNSFTGAFMDSFVLSKTSKFSWVLLQVSGRIGHAAIGIFFFVISIFIFVALFYRNPYQIGNQNIFLEAFLRTQAGRVLSLIEAVGLIIYGLFESAHYKYRYIFRQEKEISKVKE